MPDFISNVQLWSPTGTGAAAAGSKGKGKRKAVLSHHAEFVSGGTLAAGLQQTEEPSASWRLGAVDADFVKGKHPSMVELLIRLPTVTLDRGRFAAALRTVLDEGRGCGIVGGRRRGNTITAGQGVCVSTVTVQDCVLAAATPPSPHLFGSAPVLLQGQGGAKGNNSDGGDSGGSEVLTLRIATAAPASQSAAAAAAAAAAASPAAGSTLGVRWDHALSDVGGIVLFLSHVSCCYSGLPATHRPIPLEHDRWVYIVCLSVCCVLCVVCCVFVCCVVCGVCCVLCTMWCVVCAVCCVCVLYATQCRCRVLLIHFSFNVGNLYHPPPPHSTGGRKYTYHLTEHCSKPWSTRNGNSSNATQQAAKSTRAVCLPTKKQRRG